MRRLGWVFSLPGPVIGAALAGLACCAPGLAGSLAPVVFAVVGIAGLRLLVNLEAPLAFAAAGLGFLAARRAPNRAARLGSGLLGAVALLAGLTRLVWDLDPDLVMGLPPVYLFFVERQTILGPAAALALFTALIAPLETAVGAVRQALRRQREGLR